MQVLGRFGSSIGTLLLERSMGIVILYDVARWVCTHSKNPWSPFGTSKTIGAKDYSDFLKLNGRRKENTAANCEREEDKQILAKKDRHARAILRKKCTELRHTKERASLLEKLNSMSVVKQLQDLANQDKYVPKFFSYFLS
jgi:hypothetical protein